MKRIIISLSIIFITAMNAFSQSGNWQASPPSISPSSPIPACSTLTVTTNFYWLSFLTFNNDNNQMILSTTLPTLSITNSGNAVLIDVNTNLPVPGVSYVYSGSTWSCTFAPGTNFSLGTSLNLVISGLSIEGSQSYNSQSVLSALTFVSPPINDNPSDNNAAANFNTTGLPPVTATAANGVICPGNSDTLMASGALSYTWSNTATTAATIVSPTTTTVYTVTGTDGNGCTNTSSVTVAVSPLNISASAAKGAICIGGTDTLTASGAQSYVWSNAANTATTTVSPTATTTYSVTGTDVSGCSGTAQITVVVDTIPATPSITLTQPPCSTGLGTITITSPIATSLEYSANGTNYQSGTMFNLPAGTYNITVRHVGNANCVSAPATATLSANTLPCQPNLSAGSQTSNPSIAEGGSTTVSYFVSNTGVTPTTGSQITVTIIKAGNGSLVLSPPLGWTITLNNPSIVQLISNAIIQPGLINRVTIPATYTHNNTNEDAVKTTYMDIQPGSGGETITNDNQGGTFIQIN